MRFISFVVRSVMRRRVRSALTVVGIAVAVGSVVSLVGISHESVSYTHLTLPTIYSV